MTLLRQQVDELPSPVDKKRKKTGQQLVLYNRKALWARMCGELMKKYSGKKSRRLQRQCFVPLRMPRVS
jgi:hypothetical protein